MSLGLHAYGTTLSMDPAGGTNYVAIVEVVKIDGMDITITNTNFTHLQSPSGFKEFKPGMGDGGNVTYDINATKGQVNTFFSNLRVASMGFQLKWPLLASETNASNWQFSGHIDKMGAAYPDDDRILVPMSVKVTGKPTFTQGS